MLGDGHLKDIRPPYQPHSQMIHFEVVGTQSNLTANPPSAVVRCRASGADSEQAAIDFALKATARIQWTARGTLYRGNPTAKAIDGNTWEIEFPYSVTADDQTQVSHSMAGTP